jgi:hypothetical protein
MANEGGREGGEVPMSNGTKNEAPQASKATRQGLKAQRRASNQDSVAHHSKSR